MWPAPGESNPFTSAAIRTISGAGLALRLGQSEHWPWKNIDEVWDYRLSPVGLTFDRLLEQNGLFGKPEFERYKKYGFGTPSGKVELRSSTFEALGCEPLPVYREMPHSPVSDPKLAEVFPLVLITGSRFMPMYHSEQRQIEEARKKRPDPLVTLHPETAKRLNLAEGDWVKVETPHGEHSHASRSFRSWSTRAWRMRIMGGGFRSGKRRSRISSAYSNPMPMCSALTDQNFAALRSAVGLTRRCCAGLRKRN